LKREDKCLKLLSAWDMSEKWLQMVFEPPSGLHQPEMCPGIDVTGNR